MPPRVHPNRTVALCGIRSDAESDAIEKILKEEGLLPLCLDSSGIAKLMKDKTDTDKDAGRRLVFLNCKSEDAAKRVRDALNRKKLDVLGMDKYGHELQAVLKNDLRSVNWKLVTKTVTKTIEGPIATKRNVDCFIDSPLRCCTKHSNEQARTRYTATEASCAMEALKIGPSSQRPCQG